MGSSNRHWPSLFKSNPSRAVAAAHHHLHHDTSHFSNHCHKPNSYSDEKSPEPKPRWNPRPEQIRILESIFNSGLVNPPRDQIRRIRDQLQVYGHVGDANVFYWFQNRKSRSKLKLRHLKSTSAPKSSASTSSDRVSETPFPSQTLSEAPVLAPGVESCGIEAGMSYLGMLALLGSFTDADFANAASTLAFGNAMEAAAPKSTIFINEIAYEVTEMPINIREAFGENTILVHSSGHPVLTDEWGLTLHPLQHGSSYYLV